MFIWRGLGTGHLTRLMQEARALGESGEGTGAPLPEPPLPEPLPKAQATLPASPSKPAYPASAPQMTLAQPLEPARLARAQ